MNYKLSFSLKLTLEATKAVDNTRTSSITWGNYQISTAEYCKHPQIKIFIRDQYLQFTHYLLPALKTKDSSLKRNMRLKEKIDEIAFSTTKHKQFIINNNNNSN